MAPSFSSDYLYRYNEVEGSLMKSADTEGYLMVCRQLHLPEFLFFLLVLHVSVCFCVSIE